MKSIYINRNVNLVVTIFHRYEKYRVNQSQLVWEGGFVKGA